jgi:hypothetical protein
MKKRVGMFRMIVAAVQVRVGFCAPSLMDSALRLGFYSADHKVLFVID